VNCFLDTSALFKRYVQEQGSEVVDSLIAQAEKCHVSALAALELVSNLQRLRRVDRLLSDAGFASALNAFRLDITDGTIEIAGASAARIASAMAMLSATYLTPVDALQIATVLSLGPDTVFVSSDHKLNVLVRDHGIRVIDPAV
jgi:predicted nucleic acid-binding protein